MAEFFEWNIGCEACHGPGSKHVVTRRGQDIINPEDLSYERRVEVCGRCHTRGSGKGKVNGNSVGYPYSEDGEFCEPGDELNKFITDGGGYWNQKYTDFKTSTKHHQQWLDFVQSGHNLAKVDCNKCHDPHGRPRFEHMLLAPNDNNRLCLHCHGARGPAKNRFADGAAVLEHMRHTPAYGINVNYDPEGSKVGRCTTCHMLKAAKSAVPWDIHIHNFKVITPMVSKLMSDAGESTVIPNSCQVCHNTNGPGTDWGTGAAGYATAVQKYIQLFGGKAIQKFGTITGVATFDGQPVPGARISIDTSPSIVVTNDRGEYTIKAPSNSFHVIRAWKQGYATAVKTNVEVTSTVNVDLELGAPEEEEQYAGSVECMMCHSEKYKGWKASAHHNILASPAVGAVIADSDNDGTDDFVEGLDLATTDAFAGYGANAPKLAVDADGRYTVTIGAVTYTVGRVLGAGVWKQRYHTPIGNSWYILPIQFNKKTREWGRL